MDSMVRLGQSMQKTDQHVHFYKRWNGHENWSDPRPNQDKYESISLSSSKSYMRGEIGYVTEVNFVRKLQK